MKLSRLAIGLCVAIAILTAETATATLSASTHDESHEESLYLALGDSVAFGFITQAGFEYVNADNFVGYPDYVGRAFQLSPAAPSCPGETTGSFLSSSELDNGCRSYRSNAPLHVTYTSTQLEYATDFLRTHPRTRLATITLGANDLFTLQESCGGDLSCVLDHLQETLGNIAINMGTILSALRATGFRGVIVVTNYYSLDYNDDAGTRITQLLNQTLATAAASQGALIADTFKAFQDAVSNPFAAGSPCRAGLLNALPSNQLLCDIHPTQSGHKLIAETVEHAARRRLRIETD